ncbi:DedA family protein [Streptomyces sp. NBRC 110035]|uniref:DedA family protein n=1 Tax=Streptomyces sp. NBRC 110035 TaxID=1547867 RepID=UPI0006968EAE|nr:DedA family protein [Streptomyces sp. NBRC 110035]
MTAWLAEQMLVYGSFGILAAVLLLPAMEAALPVVGALLPGQTAVVLTALVGAVLGNLAGYAIGSRWKERLMARMTSRSRHRRVTERALGLIERRGGGAVFVGRFTAVLRTLVPTLCGATRMPLRRYLLWSVLSSAVWAPAFVLIGYVMGPAGPG